MENRTALKADKKTMPDAMDDIHNTLHESEKNSDEQARYEETEECPENNISGCRRSKQSNEGTSFTRKRAAVNLHVSSGQPMRVPDGGWGWMVAFGAFLITFLSIPLSTCFGILFSGYLLSEGVSSTTTAWIYNILCMVWHLMMSLVGPLCKEFGNRRVGLTATCIMVTAVLMSAFTASPYFLFFSMSLLAGVGSGIVVSMSYIVVSPYFDRRRGLANTLLVAGSPMGQMAMAPLVRYLLEIYSFKGAALIYGAILLHGLVGVALFHPLKWHMKPPLDDPGEATVKMLADGEYDESFCLQESEHNPNRSSSRVSVHDGTKNFISQVKVAEQQLVRSIMSGSNSSLASADMASAALPAISTSSCASVDGSVSSERGGILRRLSSTFIRVIRITLSNFKFFKLFRVMIISLSFMMSSISFLNFSMMAPFKLQVEGYPLQEAAWSISIMGVTNLLTRFVVSPLSDWNKFSIRFSLMFGYLLKASAVVGFTFGTGICRPVVWTAVFGVGLGSTISLQSLVIVYYVGVDNLPPVYGLTGVATALGFPILGPLIGFVRDTTESYIPSMMMIAALDLLSAIIWLPMPAAVARDTAREPIQRQETHIKRPNSRV